MKQILIGMACLLLCLARETTAADDPLPSWNDGPSKQAITSFVAKVTTQDSPDFVPPAERIAVFDNDGTLWCEQPLYFQGFLVFDEIKRLAPQHPEWKTQQPFKAVIEGDKQAMASFAEQDLAKLLAVTSTGMTVEQFKQTATAWLDAAKHPRFGRLYKECVYQPQLELLDYLRGKGFKTFIVSGGGVDFIRCYAQGTYGIPPEQVIGSSAKTKYEFSSDTPGSTPGSTPGNPGKADLIKLPEINSVDDKQGKPININLAIGRRPILAFGNSDGDQQMLEYTASNDRPSLCLLVHHDDAAREYVYDRDSKIGQLNMAWDEAMQRGWIVVSMKDDWKRIFPAE